MVLQGGEISAQTWTTPSLLYIAPPYSFWLFVVKHQNQGLNKILFNVHYVWIFWKCLGRATYIILLQIKLEKKCKYDLHWLLPLWRSYHLHEMDTFSAFKNNNAFLIWEAWWIHFQGCYWIIFYKGHPRMKSIKICW